jgi:protein-disulfide isomerase
MIKSKNTPNYLKFIIVIIAIIFLSLALLSVFGSPDNQSRNTEYKSTIGSLDLPPEVLSNNFISYIKEQIITQPTINDQSPIRGDIDAPITIYEFSCFGCPSSRAIQPIIKNILNKYPNEVKLVWKDLLIPGLYPEADQLHLAARCANNQDQFWDYHDRLWASTSPSTEDLYNIAGELDLDAKEFKQCLDDKEPADIISEDVDEAGKLSIPGTPHFYINNQEISGSATFEDFEKIIEVELNR